MICLSSWLVRRENSGANEAFAVIFDKSGENPYFCGFYPRLRAKLLWRRASSFRRDNSSNAQDAVWRRSELKIRVTGPEIETQNLPCPVSTREGSMAAVRSGEDGLDRTLPDVSALLALPDTREETLDKIRPYGARGFVAVDVQSM
jgi:hypothetical protein